MTGGVLPSGLSQFLPKHFLKLKQPLNAPLLVCFEGVGVGFDGAGAVFGYAAGATVFEGFPGQGLAVGGFQFMALGLEVLEEELVFLRVFQVDVDFGPDVVSGEV